MDHFFVLGSLDNGKGTRVLRGRESSVACNIRSRKVSTVKRSFDLTPEEAVRAAGNLRV